LSGRRGHSEGRHIDRDALCEAAIAVMDNPPDDSDLATLADHLVQAVFDWAWWGGSRLRLQNAVRGYVMASGAELDGGVIRANAIMVVNSSAGVSAGSVQLQGSLDGTNWFNLGSAMSTSTASTVFTPVVETDIFVRFIRANIATAITGGTVTAVVGLSG
jgi:hypothetical protein